jgi:hypothetical protein
MKLTVTVEGLATLSRFDPERLVERLRSEVERELQSAAASSRLRLDASEQREALERALGRVSLSSLAR